MSHLTEKQRYTIQILLLQNYTQSEIASLIGRDKSVVCREISRNCDKRSGVYTSDLAQRKYNHRKKEKPKKITFTQAIKQSVNHYLEDDFSPEQIVGYCKKAHIECVSIETIYKYIWKDKKNKGKLYKHLRTQGKRYKKRGNTKDNRGILTDRNSIENRPKIVEEKQRFGDFELDTIIGKSHKGVIVTANDRSTGLFKIKKVPSKDSKLVKQAVVELLYELKPLLHTITSDNGKEFAQHQEISKELEIDFYFANPYSPWERGANENLNGLLRQYIPKSSSFEDLTDEKLYEIQEKINNRPRKRFNFETPNFMFNQKVAFVT
jgi:transposase, IS30 family